MKNKVLAEMEKEQDATRKNSVIACLPKEVKEAVILAGKKGISGTVISRILKSKGHDVSDSTVRRWLEKENIRPIGAKGGMES